MEDSIGKKRSMDGKTVVYPTPAFVVGTYDQAGKPNVMTAAWGGICCSRPPCVAVSLRKATYTYGNIVAQEAFTVNVPSEDYVKETDYFGITSGRTEDKFSVAGLTPVKSDLVDAPYVAEFPLVLECKLLHTVEIGLHTQFIGEVVGIKADEAVLAEGETLSIEKVKPILYAPDDRAYFGVGARLGDAFSIGRQVAGDK
jgi:flavin reductase (DIM6/NTAB) family NADH-FMN oxidoreductase RutF